MKRVRGFTMVEMIVVIVLVGVIGGTVMLVFRPALQSYLDVGRRANLSNQADTALRRIASEVRAAVPNSLRTHAADEGMGVELVPTIEGGRFRTAPDTVWNSAVPAQPTRFIDGSDPVTVFDVVTRLDARVGAGDLLVIGNQAPEELYGGTSIGAIAAVENSPADAPASADRSMRRRITLAGANLAGTPFQPFGVDSGRFVVVSRAVRAVTYRCENVRLDDSGSGTGVLVRYHGYDILPTRPVLPTDARRNIVATKVARCLFQYDPNLGATQQSGFVQVQLTLADSGEQVSLTYGAHVNNVP